MNVMGVRCRDGRPGPGGPSFESEAPVLFLLFLEPSFLAAGLWHNIGYSQLPHHAQSALYNASRTVVRHQDPPALER
jgi:hypothetical protein